MAGKYDSTILTVVHPLCCGSDVHKEKVSAFIIYTDASGNPQSEVQEFGTFTEDLYCLREWLSEHRCPIVAKKNTGIYWRPVHNVLEDYLEVILVNARHVKNLPGRKTDIEDSKWLAGLLRHGLLKGSFIPPKKVYYASIKLISTPTVLSFPILSGRSLKQVEKPSIILVNFKFNKER